MRGTSPPSGCTRWAVDENRTDERDAECGPLNDLPWERPRSTFHILEALKRHAREQSNSEPFVAA